MRDEDAVALIEEVGVGRASRWLLVWIPLMRGGAEPSIIEAWKQAAGVLPDERDRAILASLSLVFAGLADCFAVWKNALKEWNLMKSQVVEEWRAEALRDVLRTQPEDRFGPLPEESVRQLETIIDNNRLKNIARQVLRIQSLAELQL